MKITKILSFTALSLLGGALQAQEKSLATLVNEKDVFLVDVRSEKEFDQGSALNAVNIPVDKIEKELLENSDYSIAQISQSTGFSSPPPSL